MASSALPLHLLLDTNTLLSLVPDESVNDLLDQLQSATSSGHIRLLLPASLRKEWQKHKALRIQKIEALTKESVKALKTLHRLAPNTAAKADLEIGQFKELLRERLALLDEIFARYSDFIPKRDQKQLEILELKEQKKAPFHNDDHADHLNDAEIIYYSIDFIREKPLDRFFFVSNNSGEFAKSRKEKDKNILHPDYSVHCPELTIHFSAQLSDMFREMERWGLPADIREQGLQSGKLPVDVSIDHSRPVIQQTLAYLRARLAKCHHWPKRLLTEHYPFIVGATFSYMHKPFTLVTDNQELYHLLTNVRIDSERILYLNNLNPLPKTDEDALKEVFQILFGQLLFRIGFKMQQEVALQYTGQFSDNPAAFMQYHTLDFPALFDTTTGEGRTSESPDTLMCRAYYCYKTQQYVAAAHILLALQRDPGRLSPFQRYIVQFNLRHLVRFLELQPIAVPDLIQECQSAAAEEGMPRVAGESDKDLVDFVQEKHFLHGPLMELSDNLEEIRRLHANKSFGNSRAADQLIEEYFQTASFLAGNYVIYDQFTEFHSFARLFMQGLLMSIDCSPLLAGRVPSMNDSFASELILQGKGEDIVRWVNEHRLLDLHYEKNGDRPPFYKSLGQLLENYEILHQNRPSLFGDEAPFLSQELDRILFGGLVLSSICTLPDDAVEDLFSSLLTFLRQQTRSHLFYIKRGIRSFLAQQRRKITSPQWSEFLTLILRQTLLQDEELVDTFCECLRSLNFFLPLNPADVERMQALLSQPKAPHDAGWSNYCSLFGILSEGDVKERLRAFAQSRLENQYSEEAYYLTRILGVLSLEDRHTQRYFGDMKGYIEKGPGPYIRDRTFYTNIRISQLINFCWKFDLPLPEFLTINASLFGAYYVWITDMDGFDYTQFDPDWLAYFFTRYYKRRYRQSTTLKNAVLRQMKEKRDPKIERFVALTYGEEETGSPSN